tara:strand:+ start:39 stop:263 length:225 start_codon:yes stop_codon:yes gene_type:complete
MSKDFFDQWIERAKQYTEIIDKQRNNPWQNKNKRETIKMKNTWKDNHKAFVYGFILASIMYFIAGCMIIGVYFK